MPPKILSRVDLPAPDEPRMMTNSPCSISKDTLSLATMVASPFGSILTNSLLGCRTWHTASSLPNNCILTTYYSTKRVFTSPSSLHLGNSRAAIEFEFFSDCLVVKSVKYPPSLPAGFTQSQIAQSNQKLVER